MIEAILGHVSGHKSGVSGVYNHAAYASQKAAALQKWADHIERITTRMSSTVIDLPRRA